MFNVTSIKEEVQNNEWISKEDNAVRKRKHIRKVLIRPKMENKVEHRGERENMKNVLKCGEVRKIMKTQC